MTAAIDLKALRLNRGLGLDEAAEAMKVHRSVLARTEAGDTKPNASNAFKIADFYGYKVTDIWPVEKAAA